jgi:hypothetical protein
MLQEIPPAQEKAHQDLDENAPLSLVDKEPFYLMESHTLSLTVIENENEVFLTCMDKSLFSLMNTKCALTRLKLIVSYLIEGNKRRCFNGLPPECKSL